MPIDCGSLAFFECVARHSVGVVNTKMVQVAENQKTESIGSATALTWQNRTMLLTARHVLEDATTTDLQFMPQATSSLVLKQDGEPQHKFDVQTRISFQVTRFVRCDWADLAIILLDPSERPRYMDFYKWDAELKTPEPDTELYALGHPSDRMDVFDQAQSEKQGLTTMAVSKCVISGKVVSDERGRYVKSFDSNLHF